MQLQSYFVYSCQVVTDFVLVQVGFPELGLDFAHWRGQACRRGFRGSGRSRKGLLQVFGRSYRGVLSFVLKSIGSGLVLLDFAAAPGWSVFLEFVFPVFLVFDCIIASLKNVILAIVYVSLRTKLLRILSTSFRSSSLILLE